MFTRKSLRDWSNDASELTEETNQVNSHKNAKLTFDGPKLLIERIAVMGLIPAASAAGISHQTARKWLRRFEEGGPQALQERSRSTGSHARHGGPPARPAHWATAPRSYAHARDCHSGGP